MTVKEALANARSTPDLNPDDVSACASCGKALYAGSHADSLDALACRGPVPLAGTVEP